MNDILKQGLASIESLASRHGWFEAIAGVQNDVALAQGELGWKIAENISLFSRAQWQPQQYSVLAGIKATW